MATSLRGRPGASIAPKSWDTNPREHRWLLGENLQTNLSRISELENANRTTIVTASPFNAGNEGIILVDDDAVGGPVTVNLPPAAERSTPYHIKKIGATGAVTVAANGAELIDNSPTQTIGVQYDSIRLAPGSGAWWVT